PAGDAGPAGPQGPKGDRGERGETGLTGNFLDKGLVLPPLLLGALKIHY
ncbi:hypothetical protein KUC05_003605, partial [Escherichia coli]|nr:hypothetical protein [Escherichia coli]EHR4702323.1 hypothetical protein [Escherichia coli]